MHCSLKHYLFIAKNILASTIILNIGKFNSYSFFIRMLVNKPKIIKTISIYFYTLYGFTQLNDHIFLMIISSFFLFFLQC